MTKCGVQGVISQWTVSKNPAWSCWKYNFYRSLYWVCWVSRPLGQLSSSLLTSNVIILAPVILIHMQHHPGCPAEGQSLQRGQVWIMPMISLMTHSTINARLLSTSAGGHRGVYWILALVPWRTPSCPSWSSSRPELEALQSDTCTGW